ncbi:MAG: DUF4190 domain-containing protein [Microbacterium sp.]|uniref:DUF4190 domain-containing protein n=1 Tax=Microbacterium sp. TaxID=51671 RepID=UPI0039E378AC
MSDQTPNQPSQYTPPAYPAAPPAPGSYAAAAKTNVMAILSLVFAFVFSILGIVFGHIALNQIKRTGEGGHGLAVAGLILGYVFTAIGVIYFIVIIVIVAVAASSPSYY